MDYKYKHGGPFVEWKLLCQNIHCLALKLKAGSWTSCFILWYFHVVSNRCDSSHCFSLADTADFLQIIFLTRPHSCPCTHWTAPCQMSCILLQQELSQVLLLCSSGSILCLCLPGICAGDSPVIMSWHRKQCTSRFMYLSTLFCSLNESTNIGGFLLIY